LPVSSTRRRPPHISSLRNISNISLFLLLQKRVGARRDRGSRR
jgi:hypothetical protein